MNWNSTKFLSAEWRDKIRHDYGRKCTEWHQTTDTVTIPSALAQMLGCYIIPHGSGPLDDLPPEFAQGIFIAFNMPTGELFLVNTEGYDYCRYIARLVIEDDSNDH